MARVPFRLPDIGEGIAEAEIVAWHVKVGDMVEEDQPVADMMTDKATVEMAAPVTGRVVEIAGAVGDQIAIGSTLVVFETEGGEEAAAAPVVQEAPAPAPAQQNTVRPEPVEGRAASEAPEARASTSLSTNGGEGSHGGKKVLASPAVRQRAKELGGRRVHLRPASG